MNEGLPAETILEVPVPATNMAVGPVWIDAISPVFTPPKGYTGMRLIHTRVLYESFYDVEGAQLAWLALMHQAFYTSDLLEGFTAYHNGYVDALHTQPMVARFAVLLFPGGIDLGPVSATIYSTVEYTVINPTEL
jgi:hypothetical protein